MEIRQTTQEDISQILQVHEQAFGAEEGPQVAALVKDLFADPTAMPLLSLLALREDRPVGHILFTTARIESDQPAAAVILAPLAVIPEEQGRGVGGALISKGLGLLAEAGVELVFVLGSPDYYRCYGFRPAKELGFAAPYPIPADNADTWMGQELRPGVIGRAWGRVQCAHALNSPEHWRQ